MIRLERGENSPNLDIVISLSTYFGVSLDYITGMSDNPVTAAKTLNETPEMTCKRVETHLSSLKMMLNFGFSLIKAGIPDSETLNSLLISIIPINDELMKQMQWLKNDDSVVSQAHQAECRRLMVQTDHTMLKILDELEHIESAAIIQQAAEPVVLGIDPKEENYE